MLCTVCAVSPRPPPTFGSSSVGVSSGESPPPVSTPSLSPGKKISDRSIDYVSASNVKLSIFRKLLTWLRTIDKLSVRNAHLDYISPFCDFFHIN